MTMPLENLEALCLVEGLTALPSALRLRLEESSSRGRRARAVGYHLAIPCGDCCGPIPGLFLTDNWRGPACTAYLSALCSGLGVRLPPSRGLSLPKALIPQTRDEEGRRACRKAFFLRPFRADLYGTPPDPGRCPGLYSVALSGLPWIVPTAVRPCSRPCHRL